MLFIHARVFMMLVGALGATATETAGIAELTLCTHRKFLPLISDLNEYKWRENNGQLPVRRRQLRSGFPRRNRNWPLPSNSTTR